MMNPNRGRRPGPSRWILRSVKQPESVARVSRELNHLPEALARALVIRGIDTFDGARRFFRPSLTELHDPFLMRDMAAAADRVVLALRRGERVLVYGDYDVDGTTSTALMTSFLRDQGAEVDYFIPNRFEHGYGLCAAGIEYGVGRGASLIIALDCGITAIDEARLARERGCDLIICDHHTPKSDLPDAVAVLDPKRPDCTYPFKELSGCGVGLKLVQAVLSRLGKDPAEANSYLDLVAISTASDIVPVYGENRILLAEGLNVLRRSPRLGLRKLAEQARLAFETCTATEIVFSIGPRINAAGRLGDAGRAVALLLEQDESKAIQLAIQLEQLNRSRRDLDREILDAAAAIADGELARRMRHSIVLHDADWHLGVVGIVASKLVERYHRPAVMLCTNNGQVKGSARSIGGFNIYQALTACKDLLTEYGGHDFAAGLTLPEENIPAFRERFDEVVGAAMTPELMQPGLEYDADLTLGEIDARFWAVLKQFAPYGPDNDRPVFQCSSLELAGVPRTVGKDGAHLKFAVRQTGTGNGAMEVIGFGLGGYLQDLRAGAREGRPLDLLFCVDENHWNGRTSIQLKAKDLRVSS
jgi:single-stranded-DNA-specific exonuclease